MTGFVPGKFQVRHHVRGDLNAEEVFVLVPGRDPAAVSALLAYARSTPDIALAKRLRKWAETCMGIRPIDGQPPRVVTKIPLWVSVLAREVRENGMPVETALTRIAGHAADSARRELGATGLTPVTGGEE